MSFKSVARVFAMAFVLAATGSAQIDTAALAASLRATYGPPLAREILRIPAGEMVIDYASSGHMCKLTLPPDAPDEIRANVRSTAALDRFLLQLIPSSLRGKELGKMAVTMGLPALITTEYENMTISENLTGNDRTSLTVSFKDPACRN